MKKKIGIFLLRGAGKEGFKEQQKFIDKVFDRLKKRKVNTGVFHVEYADWYAPTQSAQELILERILQSESKIRAVALRKFILYLVGDLVAYIGEPTRKSTAYAETHKKIHQSVLNIKNAVEDDAPLIILASSLATEIISNYIWDRQNTGKEDPLGGSSFEKMETLTGLFMLGNINPLYISSQNIDEAKPFHFPSPNLLEPWKGIACWNNLFDKNDPMGFPIRPINSYYRNMVTADTPVNAGSPLISWNAGSHLGYWKSKDVSNLITEYLQKAALKLPGN